MAGSGIKPSSNFLVCAGDDKISIVHSNYISSELTGEMIFLIELLPVYI